MEFYKFYKFIIFPKLKFQEGKSLGQKRHCKIFDEETKIT